MDWRRILVAIGANLPGPGGRTALQSCEWAVQRLAALPGLSLESVSPWYESAPVPPSGQPPFVNGIAVLSGAAEPHALLAALHDIEAEADRIRTVPNAARTLDLDLIGMDGLVLDGPLLLPHPRAAERAFVLAPLCDVAPDWRHPLLAQTAAELLPGVRGQAIRALPLPGSADATN
ncbi:MAG: 2-amino-4-hydroxy-6-hydroxymethyldihydropteridine diphosphokinase [Janthinobacterium lividum]